MTIPVVIKDLEEAKCLAQEVVTEAGEDFVYARAGGYCRYFAADRTPDCLIGRMLAKKGLKAKDLNEKEHGWYVRSLRSEALGVLECDDRTMDFLAILQMYQDQGYSWGEVLQTALRALPVNEPVDG